ncbi:MAG TPA: hypothetical protein VMS02_08750, partial [Solirubrobacteraceae bacterium]|nr:hypothetical protein [Solirubrobacteraceae bacterium]
MTGTRADGERHPPTPASFVDMAERARASGRLALDTEFMGEGRYRTLLCLVQLAIADARGLQIELLDPLAAEVPGGDASWREALASLLADPAVE